MARVIEVILVISWIIGSISGQEIYSYDNCDLISCPLDCHLSFIDNEDCPVCNCPLGQRCPNLNCPPEPMCLKVQRLDGCLNCACAGATYHAFDESRNLAMYMMNPKDSLIIPKETCNLYDIQSVQRCMKEVLSYLKTVERTNPDVIAHPMVSMFLYSRTQLLELCNLYSQSLRCVSTDTLTRCQRQERHMHQMVSTFDGICKIVRERTSEEIDRYMNTYECIRNILAAHIGVDQCSNVMSRRFGKTAKDTEMKTQTKRQRKCETLNGFMDCVEPTMRAFCGKTAVDIFKSGLLNATNAIAPECEAKGNAFVPLVIEERPLGNATTTRLERRLVIR